MKLSGILQKNRAHQRMRRFADKSTQRLELSLQAYIRVEHLGWTKDLPDAEKSAILAETKRVLKAARAGEGSADLCELVAAQDAAMAPLEKIQRQQEKEMTKLAKLMPGYAWCETVLGFGAVGFATIVAEATGADNEQGLSAYSKPCKLWSRLGLAPYEGFAMSTWRTKNDTPRSLTSEEWENAGYNPKRCAEMFKITGSLLKAQLIGKAKTESGETEADGRYGEIYLRRRRHTAVTHPEWTKMHSLMDAQRVVSKALVRDMWRAWRDESVCDSVDQARVVQQNHTARVRVIAPSFAEAAE